MKNQSVGRSGAIYANNSKSKSDRKYGPRKPIMHVCFYASEAVLAMYDYREKRENGDERDAPREAFPGAWFDSLDIKESHSRNENTWPDKEGRYWWRLRCKDGREINDCYVMRDEVRGWPDKADRERYWFSVHHAPSNTKIEGFSIGPDYAKGYPEKRKSFLSATDKYWWRCIEYTECGAIKDWMEEKDLNYLDRIQKEDPALYAKEVAAHPDIHKRQKERQTMRLPFYEGKVPNVSIAHLPFRLAAPASSSSSSSSATPHQLEKVVALGTELSRMGFSDVDDNALALTKEFKSARWQDKTSANQQIFHWVSETYKEACVTSLFQTALKSADSPDIHTIAFMMQASKSVVMFKFPFTLSSVLWKEKSANREVLRQLIYLALKRIAEEQIISDPESKCIAIFKLLLKSALKKGMITEGQFHQLDNIAEKTAIFSDERFLALKRDIESLKQQFSSLDRRMGIAEKNLELVADSVNELKYAFQQQKERRLYLSIATFGLSCFGVPALIDALTNAADLSDLAEIGSVVLQVPVEKSQGYLDGGLQALEQNKRVIAQQGGAMMLKGMGLDSDKFIETWMTANVVLQAPPGAAANPVSSSNSSSSSSSSAIQSGPPKPRVVSGYSAKAPSPARELPSIPASLSQSSSSSSSSMNTQNSSPSFFKQPSAVEGIVLQEISENEFKVSINYPKLRLSPQERTELQGVLSGNDGTGAFGYIESSAKTVKGAITELSFEDKDSADILIAELNGMIQGWKSVSTPSRAFG